MGFTIVKRSVSIAGHRTSISLEEPFWQSLREIAERDKLSIQALIGRIDAERGEQNLSSAIRVFVLDDLRSRLSTIPQCNLLVSVWGYTNGNSSSGDRPATRDVRSHPPYNGEAVLNRVAGLLDRARASGIPVFHVRHDGGSGDDLERGTPGWEIHPAVAPKDGEPIIDKDRCSAFTAPICMIVSGRSGSKGS